MVNEFEAHDQGCGLHWHGSRSNGPRESMMIFGVIHESEMPLFGFVCDPIPMAICFLMVQEFNECQCTLLLLYWVRCDMLPGGVFPGIFVVLKG